MSMIGDEKRCAVSGCGNPARVRGWCNSHYARWQRHGDPLAGGPPLMAGFSPYERVQRRLAADGECQVFTGCRSRGYGRVRDHGRTLLAHVVVWEQHHGPVPDGMVIMHRCDNPACCRIDHLTAGTQADNMADMVRKGRQVKGTGNSAAKLTEAQVRTIRDDDRVSRLIAAEYGVHERHIRLIKAGKSWKHVA